MTAHDSNSHPPTVSPRRKALYAIAITTIAAAWYVVLTDPVYSTSLHSRPSTSPMRDLNATLDGSAYEIKDPRTGSQLPAAGIGKEILAQADRTAKGYLLALIGDCGTCSKVNVEKLVQQSRERKIQLLLLSNGDKDQVAHFAMALRRNGLDVPLFRDADGETWRWMNCYYPGRLYYFDRHWKLVWRERDYLIDNYLFSTGRFDRLVRNAVTDGNDHGPR